MAAAAAAATAAAAAAAQQGSRGQGRCRRWRNLARPAAEPAAAGRSHAQPQHGAVHMHMCLSAQAMSVCLSAQAMHMRMNMT